VANEVEVVEPDHLLPHLPVAGAVRRPAHACAPPQRPD
jgi:hypothetical protein